MANLPLKKPKGIPALKSENYTEWSTAVIYTLTSHRAWQVVTGDEVEPKAPDSTSTVEEARYKKALNTFQERSSKATSIIYASLGVDHLPHISGLQDPKQMWEKIRDVFDINKNPPTLYKLHEAFHAEKFGKKDNICTWSGRLESHVRKLSSSDWPIDPRDAVHKLIHELPVKYEVVRQLLYRQNPRELQVDVVKRVLQTAESQEDQQDRGTQPGPKKKAATPGPGKKKAKKAKAAQKTAQAHNQAPSKPPKGPNDKVMEGRVKKTPQKESRRCSICHRPNHTEANCFSRERGGPGRASSAMPPPGMYQEPIYRESMYQEPMYHGPIYQEPKYRDPMYQEPMYPAYRERSPQRASSFHPREPYGHVDHAALGGLPARGTPVPMKFEPQPEHEDYGYYY